jgi:hypothetical protein
MPQKIQKSCDKESDRMGHFATVISETDALGP